MQPQTLSQIMSQLSAVYNPQIDAIKQQQAAIPGQLQAQQQGLDAAKNDAFSQIQSGAQNRGLGFSGIPAAEQAKYTGSTYMPALAKLQQSGNDTQNSLENAILKLNQDQTTQAYGIQDSQQKNYLAQQQLEAQKAAAAASAYNPFASLFGGGNGNSNSNTTNASPTQTPQATMTQRADSGFNFTDHNGQPISALTYANLTGKNFRDILTTAAQHGDQGAKAALGFVGSTGGYDPTKVGTNQNLINLYNSLVWGNGKQATPYNPNGTNFNPFTATPQQRDANSAAALKTLGNVPSAIYNFLHQGPTYTKAQLQAKIKGAG